MTSAKYVIWLWLVYLAFFSIIEQAKAEDWFDQQQRERDEYYNQIEFQREQNRLRDHEELRQTQYEQEVKFQNQINQMELERKKLINPEQPYQPTVYPPRYHQHRVAPQKQINKPKESTQEQDKEASQKQPKQKIIEQVN